MRQLQHTATNYPSVGLDDFILQHTTARCNTLQHTATHCNTMQHTGSHWITLHQTATHGNTLTLALASIPLHCKKLQETATHCNTLQHNATLQHTATHLPERCRRCRLESILAFRISSLPPTPVCAEVVLKSCVVPWMNGGREVQGS